MTFVITLLREQQLPAAQIVAFYVLLGAGVMASSWLWAGLLQRHRGGGPLALFNGLLALATLLPVLSTQPLVVFASGALFGGVFLSVVASTTALVRHNLPAAAWPAGIAAFTIVFAAGQIVGPSAGRLGRRRTWRAARAASSSRPRCWPWARWLRRCSGRSPARRGIERRRAAAQVTGAGLNSTSALCSFQCSAQVFLRPLATSSIRRNSSQPTSSIVADAVGDACRR